MAKPRKNHDCKSELNTVDLRATPARLAIMHLLEQSETPIDIQTIKKFLDHEKIETDQATVFRIMNTFTQKGLTKQISFNEGKSRYELSGIADHHHLICAECGNVEDFSDCAIPELEKDIQMKKGFRVKSHALEFYGICVLCLKKNN